MDQGIHEFSYSIFPYECASAAERAASELNFKLPFIMESFHGGTLPEVFSGFDADGCSSAILTAVKERYNGSGIVARFYEADGKDAELSFKLFGKEVKADLGKNAIITLSESGEVLDLLENEKK